MATTKSGRQFRLAEVCRMADVQPYVLKYWETEFPALAARRSGGQRNWSQEDVDIVLRIRELLYGEGFTIAGARKRLEAELADPAPATSEATPPETPRGRGIPDNVVSEIKKDLHEILALLKS